MKKLLLFFVILFACTVTSCNNETKAPIEVPECKADTVLVHDTVYVPTYPKAKLRKAKHKKVVKSITVDTNAIIENYKKGLPAPVAQEPVVIKYDTTIHHHVRLTMRHIYQVDPNMFKTEVAPQKRGFYAGMGTSIDPRNTLGSIYLGALIKDKKDTEILKLDAGFQNDGTGSFYPFIGAGLYIKFK